MRHRVRHGVRAGRRRGGRHRPARAARRLAQARRHRGLLDRVDGDLGEGAGGRSGGGGRILASPVSGNPHVVAEGGACIVASGPAEAFQRAKPYLDEIAKTVVHAGEEEQSRLVKLCHNLYLGMMVQALVEVTSLAEKGGTDRAAFLEFLNGTVVSSEWVRKRSDDLVNLDWTPTFTTELLRKDFDLGLGAARSLEVPMPVGSAVYQLIQSAIGTGLRNKDFLSLYELQAGVAAIDEGAARDR
jgi:3-hydroxyisobutyrate dehydrogenase-like beta-hydroxyacid dehydrogenase